MLLPAVESHRLGGSLRHDRDVLASEELGDPLSKRGLGPRVHEWATMEDRHVRAKPREDLRELKSQCTGADDGEVARKLL